MRIVDANVLIYAVNSDAAHHDQSRRWLDGSLNGAATVGLPWVALLAFLRIVTHPQVFAQPMSHKDAMDQLDDWLARPAAHVAHPSEAHATILGELLRETGRGGNLVNDAHLAALAIENRATLVSFDRDFARFSRVRVVSPAELLS